MSAYDRRFGVEIEFGLEKYPNGAYSPNMTAAVKETQDFFAAAGNWTPGWRFEADGSGVEAITPILQGKAGFAELERAYDLIVSNGGYVTIADGLHVHHDAPEFVAKPELCRALARNWARNRKVIYGMVAPWRRESPMCHPVDENVGIGGDPMGRGYYDLTFGKLPSLGTIEVRLHEGTLDFQAARAWIMFVQKMIHRAVTQKTALATRTEREALLEAIKIPDDVRQKLAEKEARKHLSSRFQGEWKGLQANGYRADHEQGPKSGDY